MSLFYVQHFFGICGDWIHKAIFILFAAVDIVVFYMCFCVRVCVCSRDCYWCCYRTKIEFIVRRETELLWSKYYDMSPYSNAVVTEVSVNWDCGVFHVVRISNMNWISFLLIDLAIPEPIFLKGFHFYLRQCDERSRDYQSCFCCCCCDIFWHSHFLKILKVNKA